MLWEKKERRQREVSGYSRSQAHTSDHHLQRLAVQQAFLSGPARTAAKAEVGVADAVHKVLQLRTPQRVLGVAGGFKIVGSIVALGLKKKEGECGARREKKQHHNRRSAGKRENATGGEDERQ